ATSVSGLFPSIRCGRVAMARSGARRRRDLWRPTSIPVPGAGRTATRRSAGSTCGPRLSRREGLRQDGARGDDEGGPMEFVRPFRKVGELNEVERWKLARHPLDVRDAVLDVYSKQGVAAIDEVPGEWERLKWVGLYQQLQGGDAFMLRIKVPGGRLAA